MKTFLKFLLQLGYNVAITSFFFLAGPFLLWKLWRRGKLLPQFGQRFGLYDREVRQRLKGGVDLWIHAVSVGEIMIALVIIRSLRKKNPAMRIAVTTTTATGFAVAKKQLEDASTFVLYNPFDLLWCVISAFTLLRPRRLILVESEIWPNYLWCAHRRHTPVYLVNARLSHRTEERYRRNTWLMRPLLRHLSLVMAQDPIDVARLTRAGFPAEAVFNAGSLKYDVAALETQAETDISAWWNRTGWNGEQAILLGGSTHPGEELVLAQIYRELREQWPHLRLALAPRHAERGASIKELCQSFGFQTVTRSELANGTEPLTNGHAPDVLVIDSTGELRSLYKRATLVFVGKSLRGRGGQNFIEAARDGIPVVVGPNMQNFEVATREFLAEEAIVQVNDEFELSQRLRELVRSPEARRVLGERAKATFQANLHAGDRTAEIIHQSLRAEKYSA